MTKYIWCAAWPRTVSEMLSAAATTQISMQKQTPVLQKKKVGLFTEHNKMYTCWYGLELATPYVESKWRFHHDTWCEHVKDLFVCCVFLAVDTTQYNISICQITICTFYKIHSPKVMPFLLTKYDDFHTMIRWKGISCLVSRCLKAQSWSPFWLPASNSGFSNNLNPWMQEQ